MKRIYSFLEQKKESLSIFLFMIAFILIIVGCIFVYSSSSVYALVTYKNVNYYILRQVVFAVAGIIIAFILSGVRSSFIKKNFFYIYAAIMLLLISVHFIGTGAEEVGAKSWIRIAGVGIQPSELGKSLCILTMAYFLEFDGFNIKKTKIQKILINMFLVVLPIILVLTEPDLGTTAIMAAGIMFIIYFTSIPLRYFVVIGGAGIVSLSVFMSFAAYRMNRIKAFLNPWTDGQGIGYQIIQSYYALANGGFFGMGLGNSKQKYLWLPEQHTDFIYSIITEEAGLIGAAIVLILFLSLFGLCLYMAKLKKNNFEKFAIIGLGSSLTFQAFLNIAVAIGAFPVTGVTLPFISYGGSSMISSCIMIGLMMCMYESD